jgi:hypothetical protein
MNLPGWRLPPFGAHVAAVSTFRNKSSGIGSLRSRRTERNVLIASNRSMPAFSIRRFYGERADRTRLGQVKKGDIQIFQIPKI